jgi:hypothetical protein
LQFNPIAPHIGSPGEEHLHGRRRELEPDRGGVIEWPLLKPPSVELCADPNRRLAQPPSQHVKRMPAMVNQDPATRQGRI